LLTLAYFTIDREGQKQPRELLQAAREQCEAALEQARGAGGVPAPLGGPQGTASPRAPGAAGAGKRADLLACLRSLADVALRLGDEERAWTLGVEALQVSEESEELPEIVASLELLAGVPLARGDMAAARPLLERRLALCRQLANATALM